MEIECLYLTADGEERTVYAILAGDDLSPDDCLDEYGRGVPESKLPTNFWDRVREHAVETDSQSKVCYINL